MTHLSPAELPDVPGARHLGDLARGGATWRVFFESRADAQPARGRVHFVGEGGQRSTGWIFVEWSEQDLLKRFQEFSALELWRLLESLA
jgi:hypothetical protein